MVREIAAFAGGCFWCTEAIFKSLRGILSVTSGYTGGHTKDPTYEEVCSGTTGHAEAVRIEFDPEEISFRMLLTVFFASHDPTELNRQGNDVGEQYRSAIFTTTGDQEDEAQAFIEELNASSEEGKPIVTTVEPLSIFYEAEPYHRDYYARNRTAPYCRLVINPKLEKVQQEFAALSARGHS